MHTEINCFLCCQCNGLPTMQKSWARLLLRWANRKKKSLVVGKTAFIWNFGLDKCKTHRPPFQIFHLELLLQNLLWYYWLQPFRNLEITISFCTHFKILKYHNYYNKWLWSANDYITVNLELFSKPDDSVSKTVQQWIHVSFRIEPGLNIITDKSETLPCFRSTESYRS